MEFKVHFRFNKITGEIELFEVDDEGPMRLSEDEHNRLHDQAAARVGSVIERNPRVDEVVPGTVVKETKPEEPEPQPEAEKEKQRHKP